jgi:hypothetical protein
LGHARPPFYEASRFPALLKNSNAAALKQIIEACIASGSMHFRKEHVERIEHWLYSSLVLVLLKVLLL